MPRGSFVWLFLFVVLVLAIVLKSSPSFLPSPASSSNLVGQSYAVGSNIPVGYAPPWDVFTNEAFLFLAANSSGGNLSLNVTAAHDGMIFFKRFFVATKHGWEVHDFDETPDYGGYWIFDEATAHLSLDASEFEPDSWVIVYACSLVDREWRCGCFSKGDTLCHKWSIENFSIDTTCTPNTQRPCYTGPAGTLGFGICAQGSQTCDANGTWSACIGDVTPSLENCTNGVDDDCDNLTDGDDPYCTASCIDQDNDNYNISGGSGTDDCGLLDCNDLNAAIHPGATENCTNGVDDDCDGQVDGNDSECTGPIDNCLILDKIGGMSGTYGSFLAPATSGTWLYVANGSNQRGDVLGYRLDENMSIVERAVINNLGYERVRVSDVLPVSDGAILFLVYENLSGSMSKGPLRLLKLNQSGSEVWSTTLESSFTAWPRELFAVGTNIAARRDADATSNTTLYIVSSSGQLLETHELPDEHNGQALIYSDGLFDDGYFFTGLLYNSTPKNSFTPFVLSLSTDFSEQNFTTYDTGYEGFLFPHIAFGISGYIFLAVLDNTTGNLRITVKKLIRTTGVVDAEKSFLLGNGLPFTDSLKVHDNFLYLAGNLNYSNYNGNRIYAKLDPNLNVVWSYVEPHRYATRLTTDSLIVGGKVLFSMEDGDIRLFNDSCSRVDLDTQ